MRESRSEGSNAGGQSAASAKSYASPPANSPPSISLPKRGGAIRGIGEKFAANPVTGTGSLSVPIFASLRVWSATFSLVRLRCRERTVWVRLEPLDSLDHA